MANVASPKGVRGNLNEARSSTSTIESNRHEPVVPARFFQKNAYEVLEVDERASIDEIKRAYRRVAVRVHPDRNSSPEANSEFVYLSRVHEILSDENKRQVYDRTKSLDAADDSTASQNFETMYERYRSMWPKITTDDIERFKETYINSSAEKEDVLHAFNRIKSLSELLEHVPFATSKDLERYAKIIEENTNVCYTKNEIDKQKKRARTYERREAKLFAAEQDKKRNEAASANSDSLVGIIRKRMQERSQLFDDIVNHSEAHIQKEPSEEDFQLAAKRIAERQSEKKRKSIINVSKAKRRHQ